MRESEREDRRRGNQRDKEGQRKRQRDEEEQRNCSECVCYGGGGI